MSETSEGGGLSIDAAVEQLAAPEPEPLEQEAGAETLAAEPVEEEGEPDSSSLQPPPFWTAEDKAWFATLEPEQQDKLLGYEKGRNDATSRAMSAAAEARRKADEAFSGVSQFNAQLAAFLPEARAVFADRWGEGEPDWANVADQLGADQAFKLKARHDQDKAQLDRLHHEQQRSETLAYHQYVEAEMAKLPTVAPALADPKEGPRRRAEVGSYLVSQGYGPEQIANVSASDMSIAHKAMLWDRAQAAGTRPKTQPGAARTAIRPAAAQAPASTQTREIARLGDRFARSRSLDDAVALALAKGL